MKHSVSQGLRRRITVPRAVVRLDERMLRGPDLFFAPSYSREEEGLILSGALRSGGAGFYAT